MGSRNDMTQVYVRTEPVAFHQQTNGFAELVGRELALDSFSSMLLLLPTAVATDSH